MARLFIIPINLLRDRVPTHWNLLQHRVMAESSDNLCVSCGVRLESIDDLFVTCELISCVYYCIFWYLIRERVCFSSGHCWVIWGVSLRWEIDEGLGQIWLYFDMLLCSWSGPLEIYFFLRFLIGRGSGI
jgi:hypothetical protein